MTQAPLNQSIVIMTGMHRSGTSLTASLLNNAGIDLGDRLLGQDDGNPKGHFEDLDFLELHMKILQSQEKNIAGWISERQITVPEEYLAPAQELITARSNKLVWGWKDPRTTLFLDFWNRLLPNAKYIFIFRPPWAVVDSLFRRGDVFFHNQPGDTIQQWLNYNANIEEFYRLHPENSLLLGIETIITDPDSLINLVRQKLGISLTSPESSYEASLFSQRNQSYHQALVTKLFPEAIDLYQKLQQQADLPNPDLKLKLDSQGSSWLLQDWSSLTQTLKAKTQLEQDLFKTQAKLTATRKELAKAQWQQEQWKNLVRAMESSKFWQLRLQWQEIKQNLGLPTQDAIYQSYLHKANNAPGEEEQAETFSPIEPKSPDHLRSYPEASKSLAKQLFQYLPGKHQLKKLVRNTQFRLMYYFDVSISQTPLSHDVTYQRWLDQNYPQPSAWTAIKQEVTCLDYQPLISIIVPVYNPDKKFLQLAIDSVRQQIYPNWQLCLADDRSSKPYVKQILEKYAAQDERIKIVLRQENGHISRASNSALELATGDFVALLDHDDLLAPHALAEVVKLLNKNPQADFIYSDEDKVDERNIHRDPAFKADWCPDSFLSRMYTCHLGVYRRSIVDKIGGFRPGFEGSQDYDLVLRFTEQTTSDKIFHIPQMLYHWRIHSASTAAFAEAKPYAFIAGQKALAEAITRREEPGEVEMNPNHLGIYTIHYEIKEPKLVSIIIPTKDLADVLETCISSIFEKTTYPNYEVIVVDNGSVEPETAKCLQSWQSKEPERFKFFSYDLPFNYSRINNFAASQVQGDYLLFLNNDTEVISDNWLTSMVEQAQRQTIGAVGSRLLYPDDTIQHAGVIMGMGGVAGHGHREFPANATGYASQIVTVNNYSAVTAACLMCRREVFEEVGGFEEQLAIAFNDVDFCLRLVQHGYFNIYLPHVVLYHYESKSRGAEDTPAKQARFEQEIDYMTQKWSNFFVHDPCYSPHLSKTYWDYRIEVSNT